jgi:hypothetical protein
MFAAARAGTVRAEPTKFYRKNDEATPRKLFTKLY